MVEINPRVDAGGGFELGARGAQLDGDHRIPRAKVLNEAHWRRK
jgi:hypothetical protein